MNARNKPTRSAPASTLAAPPPPRRGPSTDGPTRVKVGGGGAWDGALWFPSTPTENATAQAAKHGNVIVDTVEIAGKLHIGRAFGGKEVFFLVDAEGARVLMPEHGGLARDLADALDAYGAGVDVEIVYKGQQPIQKGKWAGKLAHTYDVFALT